MIKTPAIAIDSFASLRKGGAMMWRGAKLSGKGEYFVMEGKSGTHTLLIASTDRARLNAHWQGFTADPRNA